MPQELLTWSFTGTTVQLSAPPPNSRLHFLTQQMKPSSSRTTQILYKVIVQLSACVKVQ